MSSSTCRVYRPPEGSGKAIHSICLVGETHVAAGSVDKSIRVFEVDSGVCKWILKGHTNTVACLVPYREQLSNEWMLLSGSFDKTVRIWSLQSGQCVKIFKKIHTAWIHCMELIGDQLYTGGADKLIKATDITTGDFKGDFKGHSDPVRCITTYGEHLFSGSHDKTVKMWSLQTRNLLRTFQFNSRVFCLQVVGNLIYSGMAEKVVEVTNIDSMERAMRFSRGLRNAVTALHVHDDFLFTGSADHRALVFNVRNGNALKSLTGHTDWIRALAFGGQYLYTSSDDGTVRRFSWEAALVEKDSGIESTSIFSWFTDRSRNRSERSSVHDSDVQSTQSFQEHRRREEVERENLRLRQENEDLKLRLLALESHGTKVSENHLTNRAIELRSHLQTIRKELGEIERQFCGALPELEASNEPISSSPPNGKGKAVLRIHDDEEPVG